MVVGEGAHEGVYAPNVYLVVGSERAAIIDTAYGEDAEVEAYLEHWRSVGAPEVAAIVLTHRHGDHIGGAVRLRDAMGGAVTCNTDEREAIESDLASSRMEDVPFQQVSHTTIEPGDVEGFSVDATVGDGDTLELGGATLEFIHAPGPYYGKPMHFASADRSAVQR